MKPLLKILILDHDELERQAIMESLQKSIETYKRDDIDNEVIGVSDFDEAMTYLRADGDIQALIMAWSFHHYIKLDDLDDKEKMIAQLKAQRPEVPLYLIAEEEQGLASIEKLDSIESFFYRHDIVSDPDFIMGYILNDFDDRRLTPFWTAYKNYVIESNDSWHTPGHSGGSSFRNSPYINDFYHFYGRNVFAGDISISVDSLGSLSDSSNLIGKAQESAAYTFEVNKTYFVTNGSSTSNKIILQTLLRNGDKVIIDRNCHKSVHYGILQCQASPIYLDSVYEPTYGIFAPPRLSDVKEALEKNPETKLLVFTGCSYEGLLLDLKTIIDYAHQKGVKVFVDEAWFAYALFHPRFRYYSAINAGADYVTHSAHKVVSAFSQASYIHVNDPDFDEDFFREIYSIYTSTSPKYQLIASLDVCQKQLEMEGFKILNNLLDYSVELRDQAKKFNRIRILDEHDFKKIFSHYETENLGHDPLKILVDFSSCEYSMSDIHRYLQDEIGLEVEKYTHSTILVLLTLGGTRSKVIRLYNALKKIDAQKTPLKKSKPKKILREALPAIELVCNPAEAFFGQRESVSLEESKGLISAGLVTPYPPGIPALVPGQLITAQHIQYLKAQGANGITLQGVFDGEIYTLSQQDHFKNELK